MIVHSLCETGKLGYADEISAMLAILELSEKHDDREKTERSYYHCTVCGMIHLTSWRIAD